MTALNSTVVKDTFNCKYSEEQFTRFINDLLVGANFEKAQMILPLPDAYKDFIRSCKRICQYTYEAEGYSKTVIDVLVVKLKKTTSIDRARTAQRNFVARYLNGGRNYPKDAALVAFISEDENGEISPDWRFSFIKMDYKTEVIEDEKGKKRRNTFVELTPAKRFSFLVGTNEDTHTAQSQLKICLDKATKNKEKITLEDLVQAFDIEKVSKEFFDKYRKLYEKLKLELERLYSEDSKIKVDFDRHNINIDDFAKKTLGQLVFLYFIQKKGWLGVSRDSDWGQGDKKFLRNLFEKKYVNYKYFFNDVLEHLFYEALASDRGTGAWYDTLGCRIPFLNGGLFEPINGYEYQKTDLNIDNTIFEEIFDTFDLYNFTVKEDEPLEKEVAIDPEMLGKVFENLLPENIKQGNGSFYTRREIVHYMCQETLINFLYNKINIKVVPITEEEKTEQQNLFKKKKIKHLKYTKSLIDEIISKEDISDFIRKGDARYTNTVVKEAIPEAIIRNAELIDQAFSEIKICDPAIGSGAFPVGMMNEVVRIRASLSNFIKTINRSTYELKRHTIENSIYGVDIDPGAIEIAKLRFWLSLVVDEDDIKNIKPLPNLDYKIMQGNSLITSYNGIDFNEIVENYKPNTQLTLNLFGSKSKDIIEELRAMQLRFLNTPYPTQKTEIKKKIENLILELVKAELEDRSKKQEKSNINIEEHIRNFAQNTEKREFFPWKLFFADAFEQGGFDIVIGNPPYLGESKHGDTLAQLKHLKYYQGKMNIWYFFTCIGLDMLKENGIESFIAPNNWNTNSGASIMRNKILEETKIINYIDFGNYNAFESADQQTMIFLLQKTDKNDNYYIDYSKILDDKITLQQLEKFLSKALNEQYCECYLANISKDEYIDKFITFLKNEDEAIFNKIRNNVKNIFLTDNEIAQGIVAPQDFLNKKSRKKLGDGYTIGEGIFVLSDEEKNNLNLTEEEISDLIRPLYTSNEVMKYRSDDENKYWIIYTSSKFNNETAILKYPNIKKHLERFVGVITSDNRPYGLHRSRKESFFTGEKIISLRKCAFPTFSYVSFDCYVLQTFYSIKPDNLNLKYLTGILNSKLVSFWLKNKGKVQGNNYQIDKEPLLNIPIYSPTKKEELPVISIVDKIYALSNSKDYLNCQEKQNAVREYEKQIDLIVYKLYGLNYSEVLRIDPSFEQTENDYNNYSFLTE